MPTTSFTPTSHDLQMNQPLLRNTAFTCISCHSSSLDGYPDTSSISMVTSNSRGSSSYVHEPQRQVLPLDFIGSVHKAHEINRHQGNNEATIERSQVNLAENDPSSLATEQLDARDDSANACTHDLRVRQALQCPNCGSLLLPCGLKRRFRVVAPFIEISHASKCEGEPLLTSSDAPRAHCRSTRLATVSDNLISDAAIKVLSDGIRCVMGAYSPVEQTSGFGRVLTQECPALRVSKDPGPPPSIPLPLLPLKHCVSKTLSIKEPPAAFASTSVLDVKASLSSMRQDAPSEVCGSD